MPTFPTPLWPWLTLAGLGAFHGLNPAMGWLFAVALGMHRRSAAVVAWSLVPIVIGHALAVAVVLVAFVMAGVVVDLTWLRRIAAAVLIGWAVWLAFRGHPTRVWAGMQAGFGGLAIWSFLMAGAHGAGLMLVPALMPICSAGESAGLLSASGSIPLALAALGVHTAAMLATTAAVALAVYTLFDLAFLRTSWLNVDRIWIAALGVSGIAVAWS